ncbi:bifunctional N-acetylglucosamine-1-phosphate uridyltransferase/glucosamine-1-phosphate acetyltransferase [Kosmotoga arenicorallina S304]|uniref:Bifunctional protein GlmU n=1 Tax=Kosmotoga arenicorallina S304 TaxID=1453497 RepID=A0A176K040_9BACT|nr:bifunctional UDP-N-acetylglucosamine diphosphorylase/glucosamine-1-phosphate N-acetyltransferase GlmU [Kosmotoga arenicorallina]OAA29766.1 bifunctional N-acetylglucosamine-1-phosphate uridyltransferase/glucosamine-1-phosphate acetyltransferase [Kosmotoga arenicorallina S304]
MKAIVLAAGLGKRMKSSLPKVIHKILGKPMVNWVISSIIKSGIKTQDITVVTGYKAEIVEGLLPEGVKKVRQNEQLGTGHAVMQAMKTIEGNDPILVIPGDVPLIEPHTIKRLLEDAVKGYETLVLTMKLDDPAEYGRVIEKNGKIRIVEAKDASPDERKISEVNTGIYVFDAQFLRNALEKLSPDNAQGEYYLTDVVQFAQKAKKLIIGDPTESIGINNRIELSRAQKVAQLRINRRHQLNGVTIIDPDSTYIDPEAVIGKDTVIEPMTFIYGKTTIGERCNIGPFTRVFNSAIHNDVTIVRSEVDEAVVHNNCSVGPFSRLRPGAILLEGVKIGNFVEVKKATIGKGSKAQHLTYIGDAEIGENVNVGAGTITCNYDGRRKHRTVIGDGSFIGSNTALVAPVNVGKGSVIGAGSVITEDVPDYSLGLGRARQVNKIDRYRKSEKGE